MSPSIASDAGMPALDASKESALQPPHAYGCRVDNRRLHLVLRARLLKAFQGGDRSHMKVFWACHTLLGVMTWCQHLMRELTHPSERSLSCPISPGSHTPNTALMSSSIS